MEQVVLLVEDEPTLGEVLQAFLTQKGWIVHRATDGQVALSQAVQTKPDVVLLDLNLPGLMGQDLCKQLKEHPQLKHVPVLMMTGKFQEVQDRVAGLNGGADDYLIKPFDLEVLHARLTAVTRRRPSPE